MDRTTSKLDSHGSDYRLAPMYKVIAFNKLLVGRAKEHFDLWEAEHKHESDCGITTILCKIRYYSINANLESSASEKKNDDDMDTGSINKNKEAEDNNIKEENDNTWWEEHMNAIAKGKGKGKGPQGSCYNCGEYGQSIIICPG